MSLVDYASSSDEEESAEHKRHRFEPPPVQLPANTLAQSQNKLSGSSIGKQREEFSNQPQPADLRLPDASFLLNSPAMPSHLLHASDHGSRVAAAMAESASRKRDLTGSSSSFPRSKVPKGKLPHAKSGPDTAKGLLLPPQLTGRSNVVTEDISKLFVKKRVDSSP